MSDNRDNYGFAELKTDVAWIKKILGNHLQHHETQDKARRQQMWTLVGLLFGCVITLVMALVAG